MRVLYFAWLREKIGVAGEDITVPPDINTAGDLRSWLASRGPGYQAALANAALVRCAVDQAFAGPEMLIAGAKEIAFFPPVTGG